MAVNKADVCFNVYGTASASSVSTLHEDRAFWLELEIRYADGNGEWHHKEFSDTYSGDQTVSFTAKPQRRGVEVESVAVTIVYRNNANSMGFHCAMLNVDMTGTTYDYDSEGNLISAEDNADRNQTYSYSDANELLETVDAKNERYSYTYASDNEHQLIAARSNQLGNGTVYSYDDYGNATWFRTGTVNEDGTLDTSMPFIGTSRGFNDARNYVTYEQDARGNRVNQYEEKNGNLLKTTYGNGDWWSYTYDFFDRVTKKTAETGTAAEYVYNNQDQLVRLTDYLSGNTTEYTYDLLGRLTGSRTNGNNDVRAETATTSITVGQDRPTSPGEAATPMERSMVRITW